MQINLKKNFIIYLIYLSFFSVFFLYTKHDVGNDSTISEWLINYTGGFTKRGLIGQIAIFFSNFFNNDLRNTILFLQIVLVLIYLVLIYFYFYKEKFDRYYILALFSPIFLLYPVAEIEVLARKEIFIFVIFLIHLNISIKNISYQRASKLTLLPLSVLIWEPVIFFLPFWIFIDIVIFNIKKVNFLFLKEILFYIPSILISFIFIFFPLSDAQHSLMALKLKENFNEVCYMSCALLNSKSSILQQFQGNIDSYSFEIFIRYILIIIIGFGPLFFLIYHSKINFNKTNFFYSKKMSLFTIFIILLSPVLILFAMGYDWGRWVNISYVIGFLTFVFLKKNHFIKLKLNLVKKNKLNKISKKLFIFIFIVFCFSWNPKTVITGDVASFPIYRIPAKFIKISFLENE